MARNVKRVETDDPGRWDIGFHADGWPKSDAAMEPGGRKLQICPVCDQPHYYGETPHVCLDVLARLVERKKELSRESCKEAR